MEAGGAKLGVRGGIEKKGGGREGGREVKGREQWRENGE